MLGWLWCGVSMIHMGGLYRWDFPFFIYYCDLMFANRLIATPLCGDLR